MSNDPDRPQVGVFRVDLTRSLQENVQACTDRVERAYCYLALREANGHIGRAARICGVSVKSFRDRLKYLDMVPEAWRFYERFVDLDPSEAIQINEPEIPDIGDLVRYCIPPPSPREGRVREALVVGVNRMCGNLCLNIHKLRDDDFVGLEFAEDKITHAYVPQVPWSTVPMPGYWHMPIRRSGPKLKGQEYLTRILPGRSG